MKKTCYVQEKMAASCKCFEDQNFFDILPDLAFELGWREWVELRLGSRQK